MFLWILGRIAGACASSDLTPNWAWKKVAEEESKWKKPFLLSGRLSTGPSRARCSEGVCARGLFRAPWHPWGQARIGSTASSVLAWFRHRGTGSFSGLEIRARSAKCWRRDKKDRSKRLEIGHRHGMGRVERRILPESSGATCRSRTAVSLPGFPLPSPCCSLPAHSYSQLPSWEKVCFL